MLRHLIIRHSFQLRRSEFVVVLGFNNDVESSAAHERRSQHDRLSARGTDAHHGKFRTGQFGNEPDIFSRGRGKLRKFTGSVYGRIPASNFFVDRFAVRQLSCVTRGNIQALSV